MKKKIDYTIPIDDLLSANKRYTNLYKMAEDYNTTRRVIENTFKYHNIPIPLSYVKSTVNENFFSEINEKSMYHAGFIAADGCVCVSKTSVYVKIKVHRKDREIVEKFKSDLNSTKKIYDYNHDKRQSSQISINSKKLCTDLLINFGITTNKTRTYKIPKNIISHPLFRHFIRGYIDGDGCYYYRKNKNFMAASLSGASGSIEQIYDHLKEKLSINFSLYATKTKKNIDFWTWKITRKSDNIKLFEYLYSEANIYLKRKYNEFVNIKQMTYNSFDPIELQNLYNKLKSFKLMAKHYGCSQCTIAYQMKKFKLKFKIKKGKPRKFNFSNEDLINDYKKFQSVSKLSQKYNCSSALISTRLMELGVKTSKPNKHRIK